MRTISRVVAASMGIGAFLALLLFVPATASAQLPDQRTIFTFSSPVTLPGVTLPAGKYIFEVANPDTSVRAIQVFNDEHTKLYTQFFGIVDRQLNPPDKPEIRFMETPQGVAPAVEAWWYPGDRSGYELVYPKAQARELAKFSKKGVLTTEGESSKVEETGKGSLIRIDSAGRAVKVADGESGNDHESSAKKK